MKILGQEIFLLILDVDGVLTDFYHIIQLVKDVGKDFRLPVGHIMSYFKKVRKGKYPLHVRFKDDVKEMWPHLNKGEISDLVSALREKERKYIYKAYDGVNEFLFWLREKGVVLAICTRNNHKALSRKLTQAGIDKKLFSVTSVPGRYAKPDPRCVHAILEATGMKKEYAVFVGDWFPDFNAARHAGVTFIGTTCGVLSRKAFLDAGVPKRCIVKTLPDLRKLVTE